eukprot:CAMPEP_0184741530 /NCGR_PEP_ID=MMETSP0315-20130426/4561_1 /TAXON_ID=101924 /ORGANISM="Rhodosorus marinus, Strain UTEX LB 2760" /LENGTH=605 /DNA_ID=CAMNT_0027211881 /DNA_START=259 /DNA_END=2076 /DNA_ORIENTATION=+
MESRRDLRIPKSLKSSKETEAEKAIREMKEFCPEEDGRAQNVLVVYATEYGFSKEVARKVAEELAERMPNVAPRIINAVHSSFIDLSKEQVCLLCCSTTGDGVIPTDAKEFYDLMNTGQDCSAPHLKFSVCALGDRGYPHFCRGGQLFLSVLESYTGCKPFVEMKEIDQEDWEEIEEWVDKVAGQVESMSLEESDSDYLEEAIKEGLHDSGDSNYSLANPLHSPLQRKRPLTKVESREDKETVHFDFDLSGSGLKYTCGDALGIIASNCPDEVNALIEALKCDPQTLAKAPGSDLYLPFEEIALKSLDLKTVKPDFVAAVLGAITSEDDRAYATKVFGESTLSGDVHHLKANPAFHSFASARFMVDVLNSFPSAKISPKIVVEHARALIPRFYSISSSPNRDEHVVSIAAAVVRYELFGVPRSGVATTYLADRVQERDLVKLYIQKNNNFRLPADDEKPIIMIGAGTGVAPYIAFLQDREIRRATGESVLFFGCRHEDKDFLYKNELQGWAEEGIVELYTAFSRDTEKKVYIQHRMEEHGDRVWKLICSGAHLYVCGDANQMAKDVHEALRRIISTGAGISDKEADAYLEDLERKGRYQRDVWLS